MMDLPTSYTFPGVGALKCGGEISAREVESVYTSVPAVILCRQAARFGATGGQQGFQMTLKPRPLSVPGLQIPAIFLRAWPPGAHKKEHRTSDQQEPQENRQDQ